MKNDKNRLIQMKSQVLSKYIHKLGVSPLWSLTDVFGLEPDQLEWMPKPVKAVILLFPDSVSKIIDKFNERLPNANANFIIRTIRKTKPFPKIRPIIQKMFSL